MKPKGTLARRKAVFMAAALAVALLLSMALVLQTTMAAPEISISGSTATVATDGGLFQALKDKSIDTIIFANDIVVNRKDIKIEPNRNNPNLVIDGAGYKLTEYWVKAYDCGAAIRLEAKGKMNTITVQNMEIIGQNGYGNIYIPCGVKDVTVAYKNVRYTGPQMAFNECGKLVLEDCDIHIAFAKNGTYIGELGEIKHVEMKGSVTIFKDNDTDGCADEIFWIKSKDGSIAVAPGAVVDVVYDIHDTCTPGGFIYGSCTGYAFTIGDGASFTYTGRREFYECGAPGSLSVGKDATFRIHCTADPKYGWEECRPLLKIGDGCTGGDCTVGEGATFEILAVGDKTKKCAIKCLLYVGGNLLVKEDASFSLVARDCVNTCVCWATLVMKGGAKSSATFNNPSELFIYNGNDQKCELFARAISYECNGKITFTGSRVAMWDLASNYDAGIAADRDFDNHGSKYTFSGTVKGGCDGIFTGAFDVSGYNNAAEPLTAATASLKYINVIHVWGGTKQQPQAKVITGNWISYGNYLSLVENSAYENIPGAIVEVGVVFAKSDPNLTNPMKATGAIGSPFSTWLTELSNGVWYYAAYVTNDNGDTYYGEVKQAIYP